MKKRVLDVGQCPPDQRMINRFLHSINDDIEIEHIDRVNNVFELLQNREFDLVLINRKIDYDYSDGLELIKSIKKDEKLSHLPLMLISNYPEAQAEAIRLGAEPGFGKNFQLSDETLDLLKRHLN